MNLPEAELEKILRAAPKMKAPAGLKERLLSEARSAAATEVNQAAIRRRSRLGWARRWWPAFAPAMISVACAVVLAVQQQEIQALKSALARPTLRSGHFRQARMAKKKQAAKLMKLVAAKNDMS